MLADPNSNCKTMIKTPPAKSTPKKERNDPRNKGETKQRPVCGSRTAKAEKHAYICGNSKRWV